MIGEPDHRLGFYAAQMVCRLVLTSFFRVRVFHMTRVPRTGGALLVANHQSYLDPVLAGYALPRDVHFMARDSLFKQSQFAGLIRYLNAYPVRRGTADVGAIKETLKRLKQGALITIFPEGTRSEDGSVAPLQAGTALIARRAKVPMIPTAIAGAYEAWPRTRKLPRLQPMIVAYGEPLSFDEIQARGDEECMAIVRSRIVELLEHYRRHPLLTNRPRRSVPAQLPPPTSPAG